MRPAASPWEFITGKFGPVFLLGCAAAQMMVFGRYVLRLSWAVAPLPVVGVFWIVGVPAIAGKIFATFTAFGAVLVMSPSLGFLFFFVIATIICDDRQRQPRPIGWTAAILVLLAFLLTGARVVGPPVLLCAIALLWAVDIGRYRRIPWRTTIHLLACGAGFAAGLFFFFTIGQAFSGLGFASFTGEPFSALTDPAREALLVLPAQLMAWHLPRLAGGDAGVPADRTCSSRAFCFPPWSANSVTSRAAAPRPPRPCCSARASQG